MTKFEHFDNNLSNLFREAVSITVTKHTFTREQYVRTNQAPFITKTLSNEIVKRSRFRNKLLNTRSDIDRMAYNKQRSQSLKTRKKMSKVILTSV